MGRRAMSILWPAFLMAGVLEGLVFAVVDPGELSWFGGPAIAWPVQAVYSVTFLIFWGVITTAAAMSALLLLEPDEMNALDAPDRGGAPHGVQHAASEGAPNR